MEYTGQDYASDMAAVAEDETTREWWRLAGRAGGHCPLAEEGRVMGGCRRSLPPRLAHRPAFLVEGFLLRWGKAAETN